VTAGHGGPESETRTRLERRYRRWLLAYPAEYRRERGDELVATLLDLAEPGRTRPRPLDLLDLLRAGLIRRVADAWSPARRSRWAAAVAASLAALAAGHVLWVSLRGPGACTAISTPADAVPVVCPGGQSVSPVLILNRLGYAWLAGTVLLAGLPLLGGGRRISMLAACLLTALCAFGIADVRLIFLPSLVASWYCAATARTARRAATDEGSDARVER
jgi:hypothetical protein